MPKRIAMFALFLLISLLFFLFSPTPEQKESPPLRLAHDKGSLPRFHQAFEIQALRAEEATGHRFVPLASQTTDLFISRMRANLPTKEAPEFFTWWAGNRVLDLVEKGLVADLTHLWDKHQAHYPDSIRHSYTQNGRVYGFPYSVEYWPIWYNKEIFNRLGLSPPQTWEAFIAICETLKANGIPPLLSSLQLSWYATIWFSQLLMGEDPLFYAGLHDHAAPYRDPRVRHAMEIWKDMLEKEYFTPPSTRMFTNGAHLWREEAFAMVLCGSWYPSAVLMDQGVDGNHIGVFILPPHNPQASKSLMMESGPLFIAAQAPQRKTAESLADWWMDTEGSLLFSQSLDTFSANRNVDQGHLPEFRKALLSRLEQDRPQIQLRFWEAAPRPILEPVTEILARFMLHPESLETTMENLISLPEYKAQNQVLP